MADQKTSISTVKAMAVFIVGTHLLRFMFSSVYFKQVGLSSSYSGILLGMSRLTEAIGGLIFGYIADRANVRNLVLKLSYLAYSLTPMLTTLPTPIIDCRKVVSLSNGSEIQFIDNRGINDTSERHDRHFSWDDDSLFITLLVIICLGDFFGGATINMMDTLAVTSIEDKKQYGKIRLWGNIGQAVTIPLVAIITYFKQINICGEYHSDYGIALYITTIVSGIGWFIALFRVQMPPSKDEGNDKEEIKDFSLKELILPIGMWSLLINALFYGIFIGSISSFLFWTMSDLDPSVANLSIAVANFLRNATALVVYYYAPKFLSLAGYRNILNISCIVFCGSFIVASFMNTPWLGIAVEMLTSSGKALAMAACVSYIGEVAHPSLAVTAQGLLHLMFTGVGPAVGPFLTGFFMEYMGRTITFLIFAGLGIVGLLFSVIMQWIMKVQHGDYKQVTAQEKDNAE